MVVDLLFSIPIMVIPFVKSMLGTAPPTYDNAPNPVNHVASAPHLNHANARGATYLLIAAGPGPSVSAVAAPTAGTCTKLK